MKIIVLKEQMPGETRVALMPDSIRKLIKLNIEVAIEKGAGLASGALDEDYVAAGASVHSNRSELISAADMWAVVNKPERQDVDLLQSGTIVLGFLKPLENPKELLFGVEHKLTLIAVELIPRLTPAQNMDALTSTAMIVGYKAVLMAAEHLPKMFPLLMTASGTVPPAKVMVLGAGVAGLQAISAARRLGAVVEAYDIRSAAEDQVKSLGAKFIKVDLGGIKTEGGYGYAVELSEEALNLGREEITRHAKTSDVIISTANVPGKKAPILITEDAVNGMKPGSIIVDTAASTGGNCSLSKPDQIVDHRGVKIFAPRNLAATVPFHASLLYSNNLTAILQLLIKESKVNIDLNNPITRQICVIHQGQIIREDLFQ